MQWSIYLATSLLLISSAGGPLTRSQTTDRTDDSNPKFDAVSIRQIQSYERINTPGSTGFVFARHKPCVYSEDKVLCQLSLEELIREAYQRKRYEVTGPKWLVEDVFVFQAILAGKTSKEQARLMMQSALAERFGLRCHFATKPLQAYVILVGPGGLHLTPANSPDLQTKISVAGGPRSSVTNSDGRFAAVAIRLDDLGPWIERSVGLDVPVLNGTSLHEQYKIDLKWNPHDDSGSLTTEKDLGIIGALKNQTGLVLRKQNVSADMLVVDQVSRTPTPN